MATPKLQAIDLDLLEHVSGGMNWQQFRQSDNVEDRRPEMSGGPVSNDAWNQEQSGYDNSCWWGADGNQYSGDSNGGAATPMPDNGGYFGDSGGDSGGGDYGGE